MRLGDHWQRLVFAVSQRCDGADRHESLGIAAGCIAVAIVWFWPETFK